MKRHNSGRAGSFRQTLLLGAACMAFGLPGVAFAQDDGEEEELALPASDDQGEAETGNLIVVTATKRERTLQDTPVAVSVATGRPDRACVDPRPQGSAVDRSLAAR